RSFSFVPVVAKVSRRRRAVKIDSRLLLSAHTPVRLPALSAVPKLPPWPVCRILKASSFVNVAPPQLNLKLSPDQSACALTLSPVCISDPPTKPYLYGFTPSFR